MFGEQLEGSKIQQEHSTAAGDDMSNDVPASHGMPRGWLSGKHRLHVIAPTAAKFAVLPALHPLPVPSCCLGCYLTMHYTLKAGVLIL
jgi:hypothetical protein